jgi:hypothetical protein
VRVIYRKYGNRPREIDGHKFASGAEATRYLVLKDEARRGKIRALCLQPHFGFIVGGRTIGRGYRADFQYMRGDRWIVEEVKGCVARDWPLRRDLFLALYPEITLLVNGKEVVR